MRDKTLSIILVTPTIAILIFVTLIPTLYAYYFSVHDVRLPTFFNPPFVGAANYEWVLTNQEFWNAIKFTVLFTGTVTPIEILFGLALALLLDKHIKGKRIIITIFIIPLGIAPALFAILIKQMLNEFAGLIPYFLNLIGVRISFFKDFIITFITLVITDVIQWTPFVFIILYAALQALPREPSEAALIDGASTLQILRFITIPLLKPVLTLVIILRLMDAFKVFELINIMTRGAPGTSTESITFFIYQLAWAGGYNNYGYASAATIALFYLIIAVTIFGLWILKRVGMV